MIVVSVLCRTIDLVLASARDLPHGLIHSERQQKTRFGDWRIATPSSSVVNIVVLYNKCTECEQNGE